MKHSIFMGGAVALFLLFAHTSEAAMRQGDPPTEAHRSTPPEPPPWNLSQCDLDVFRAHSPQLELRVCKTLVPPCMYTSIQAAIDDAILGGLGHFVTVDSGVYDEALELGFAFGLGIFADPLLSSAPDFDVVVQPSTAGAATAIDYDRARHSCVRGFRVDHRGNQAAVRIGHSSVETTSNSFVDGLIDLKDPAASGAGVIGVAMVGNFHAVRNTKIICDDDAVGIHADAQFFNSIWPELRDNRIAGCVTGILVVPGSSNTTIFGPRLVANEITGANVGMQLQGAPGQAVVGALAFRNRVDDPSGAGALGARLAMTNETSIVGSSFAGVDVGIEVTGDVELIVEDADIRADETGILVLAGSVLGHYISNTIGTEPANGVAYDFMANDEVNRIQGGVLYDFDVAVEPGGIPPIEAPMAARVP